VEFETLLYVLIELQSQCLAANLLGSASQVGDIESSGGGEKLESGRNPDRDQLIVMEAVRTKCKFDMFLRFVSRAYDH